MKVIKLLDVENEIYGDKNPYSEEGINTLRSWLSDNDVCYYGRPKEDFFISEAIEIAERVGTSSVLVENLS